MQIAPHIRKPRHTAQQTHNCSYVKRQVTS